MSYAARLEERQKNLDRLSSKHGLGQLKLKDHRIIAGAA
jgi:hypothetical protein